MTYLDKLIAEHCPGGVPFKALGEIGTFYGGLSGKSKEDFKDGNAKFITYMNVFSNISLRVDMPETVKITPNEKQNTIQYGDVLFTGSSETPDECGMSSVLTAHTDEKLYLNSFCFGYRFNDSNLVLPEFSKYLFRSEALRKQIKKTASGVTRFNVSKKKMESVIIPLPPLDVQSEIVRILDNFTEFTAELTAELTARKKQYEFYRDKLLTFDNVRGGAASDVVWKTLAEIADISTGSSNTDDAVEGGCYPFFVRSQQPLAKDEYEYDEEAIITAGDGVGVGKVFHYINGKYALHQRAYRIHPTTDRLLGKYLYHYFVATFPKYIGQQMYQGSVPSIRRPMLNKFQVAIPSLDVQRRIVNVLDNFDAICSDLNIGLPAEIEARQKQYEFYRDALLTYAATGKTILTDRQTDRQTDEYNALIRLCQYVFGYVRIELGTIGKVSMCKRIMKSETSTTGDVPFFKIGTFGKDPDAYISREKFEEYKAAYAYPRKGDILISAAGTIGRTVIFDGEDAYYQDSNIVWIANDESIVLNRYLYYYYQLQPWNVSTGGTIARLYNDNISKAKITVPSINEQKRIVGILDRFDALCYDLTSGLPAEIEARQKQYEFFRDKLLTFEKAGV